MGLLPGYYVPLQMLSHPPLPLFTTFLSTQGRDQLTGSYLMWSPFPKKPTKMMLDSLDQYPSSQLSVKFSKGTCISYEWINFYPEMYSQTCNLGLEKTDLHHSSAHRYTPVASFHLKCTIKWPVSFLTLLRLLSLCLTRHFSTSYIN